MANQWLSWLPFLPADVPADFASPREVAAFELAQALPALSPNLHVSLAEDDSLGEGFHAVRKGDDVTIFGGKTGLLYGAYWLLMALASGSALPEDHSSAPQYALRMINCWDNADGNVERGYSGRSLFFQGGKLAYDPARMRQLGRMMASVGLNVLCINNVNVHDPAQLLIEDDLPDLAKLAAIFRPFGVRLMVSIDYSQPMRHGIPTADPLDERVQAWWKHQAEVVYAAIPDLAGFLVKADSEHRPGPFTYGRNHAEGANMLARALKPFGGMLVWRCFVYNCQQDWRDEKTDRPKAAYEHYVYLDGQFDDNVILQVKNGPFDFQVREPISPTLLAMPQTNLALEWQLAQEYTGQQIDIFAMPVMWQELFADMPRNSIMAMAAVSNLGNDACMTGHPFAALNFLHMARWRGIPMPASRTISSTAGFASPIVLRRMMRTRWRTCCSAAATLMSSTPRRWASAGWSRRTSITGRVPTATSIRRGALTTRRTATPSASTARRTARAMSCNTRKHCAAALNPHRPARMSCCSSSTACRTPSRCATGGR